MGLDNKRTLLHILGVSVKLNVKVVLERKIMTLVNYQCKNLKKIPCFPSMEINFLLIPVINLVTILKFQIDQQLLFLHSCNFTIVI